MRAAIIGITGRSIRAAKMGVVPAYEDARAEAYMSEIAEQLAAAGAIPVYLPDARVAAVSRAVNGIVLAGGSDLDPRSYGQVPSPAVSAIDGRRDRFEFALFEAAAARGLPILGICRGQQLINVALGGSLHQDLPIGEGESHASQIYERDQRVHGVRLQPGTGLHGLYGDTVDVNSYHHQSIDRLAPKLRVAGTAADGVIEAIEHESLPITGVQWHPESFPGDPIFPWFVQRTERAVHEAGDRGA